MTLELRGVSKSVAGQVHIAPADLVLRPGTMNVLLGVTGSGKTSLMRLMAGLDEPGTGQILWNGQDVTGKAVQSRDIAMVYQQFINYPTMSVYDNIASPLRLQGKGRDEIDTIVRSSAGLMKLEEALARKPPSLSGGQQQRCALARALAKGAGLVLLDEPLANLDFKLREALREEIPKIFAASGAIFVYATTEPQEALMLGGQTAALHDGRITQFGPAAQVYRQPVDLITAQVCSDPPMNCMTARKAGASMVLEDGQSLAASGALAALPDGPYQAGFRAHHLALIRHGANALRFDCHLALSEITGSETYLYLRRAGHSWIALLDGVQQMEPGGRARVYLDPARIYWFDGAGACVVPAAG